MAAEAEDYFLGLDHSGQFLFRVLSECAVADDPDFVVQMGAFIMVAGLYASINSIIDGTPTSASSKRALRLTICRYRIPFWGIPLTIHLQGYGSRMNPRRTQKHRTASGALYTTRKTTTTM